MSELKGQLGINNWLDLIKEDKNLNGAYISIAQYIYLLEIQLKKQKEIINRTIDAIDLVIESIKQQPTEDDSWILDKLNGFKFILEDKEV